MRQKATLFPSPPHFIPLPISFLRFFVYLAPKSVTFYERSFVLPHCASAATQFGQVPLLFALFSFVCFLAFPDTPSHSSSTSSSSTSCCFRNFMLLTNFSLSGLLFTRGSPSRELRLTPSLPRFRLMFYCCCCR